MTTSNVQKHIAQWSPSVLLLAVAGYLSGAFLDFKEEVLIGLTELRAQVKRQTSDIAELRQRSGGYVTQQQMQDYVELQLLKRAKNK